MCLRHAVHWTRGAPHAGGTCWGSSPCKARPSPLSREPILTAARLPPSLPCLPTAQWYSHTSKPSPNLVLCPRAAPRSLPSVCRCKDLDHGPRVPTRHYDLLGSGANQGLQWIQHPRQRTLLFGRRFWSVGARVRSVGSWLGVYMLGSEAPAGTLDLGSCTSWLGVGRPPPTNTQPVFLPLRIPKRNNCVSCVSQFCFCVLGVYPKK